LGGELHFSSQTGNLLFKFKSGRCEFNFHILNLGLLLRNLYLEVLSQFVVLLKQNIEFLPIVEMCLPLSIHL
jgi:hypothetical protein